MGRWTKVSNHSFLTLDHFILSCPIALFLLYFNSEMFKVPLFHPLFSHGQIIIITSLLHPLKDVQLLLHKFYFKFHPFTFCGLFMDTFEAYAAEATPSCFCLNTSKKFYILCINSTFVFLHKVSCFSISC
jgi:hypothetical protein